MARLSIETLTVTSFATQEAACECPEQICTGDISTCPRTSEDVGCPCTADVTTCPDTAVVGCECPCTADFTTCPRP
jgi:hypothetical protein